MEKRTNNVTSYSRDGRFLFVDLSRVTDKYLKFLLSSVGNSNSFFAIRYSTSSGSNFELNSQDIITEDPEDDGKFINNLIKDIKRSPYLEIEKVLAEPQSMIPAVEYYIK